VANLAQPTYYAQQEPPEAQSIKSMFHITRILALIFGIIFFLGGLALVGLDVLAYDTCTSLAGNVCVGLGFLLVGPIFLIFLGVINVIIFMKMGALEALVNAKQYDQAKSATLIWMILGFIFGIIIGVLLLIAYLKFDPLINAQRAAMGGAPPPGYYTPQPQPGYAAPPPQMAPPPAPMPLPAQAAPPAAPVCPTCGQPGTYVAQYGRYYCYTDKAYL
jgi:hypothetical protein